jgi:hypothetical protein
MTRIDGPRFRLLSPRERPISHQRRPPWLYPPEATHRAEVAPDFHASQAPEDPVWLLALGIAGVGGGVALGVLASQLLREVADVGRLTTISFIRRVQARSTVQP